MKGLKASVHQASAFHTVGATERYAIGSFSDGLAYLITDRSTGGEQLLIGEAAFLFHRELQFIQIARSIAGSRVASRPWAESLDYLAETFRQSASASAVEVSSATRPEKN